MIDGGPGAAPPTPLNAWLVTDERAELISSIRRLAARRSIASHAGDFEEGALTIERLPVIHTNHPTFGYRIRADGEMAVWAPEFYEFPRWAHHADLMFAEAAGWNRPIHFAGGVGGHLDVMAVAKEAHRFGVKRLVFAHIGRPTIRAISAGERPPFGEFAADGQIFVLRAHARGSAGRRGRAPRPAAAPFPASVIAPSAFRPRRGR